MNMMVKFDFSQPGVTSNFSHLLRQLKADSGCAWYDDEFEKWLWDNLGIKQLHENEQFPSHLTGVEMSDEAYTMLLLKVNSR